VKNLNLCYVNTVDWKDITNSSYWGYIVIKDNRDKNECADTCPHIMDSTNGARQLYLEKPNCWTDTTLQTCNIFGIFLVTNVIVIVRSDIL